jgi:hypothetical protein
VAGESVGPYAIQQGTLALSANYVLTYTGGSLTITPRAVTVTADPKTKIYGDADPGLTYQITTGNLVNGDAFSGALTRVAGENVGSYAIQQGTLVLGTNYTLGFVTKDLSITPRPIGITADAKSKVYGNADPAFTYQLTSGNLIGTDVIAGTLTRAPGENVGTYAIGQGTVTAGANYTLGYTGANLTITVRPITVTADAKTKVYGDADPALTYQITSGSLAFTDAFMGALARGGTQNVGGQPINQNTLALTTNYALTYVGANLVITARPITLKPVAPDLIWTGSPQTPAYTLGIANGSVGNGDPLSVFTGAIYSPMSVTLVGTYYPTLTGAANTNYTVSYASGVFKVLDQSSPTGSITELNPVPVGTMPTIKLNLTDVATGNSKIASWQYRYDNNAFSAPIAVLPQAINANITATLPATSSTDVIQVCVRGTDEYGNTSDPICALLAVYDPTAGFVTGGGWVNSPAGAYIKDLTLTGKANFGFVSKYQKGANVPTGNTEFQFKEGNLNFSSTSFQWLVIQGSTGSQFKGVGTINGQGSYNFLVTAVDGDNYGNKKPDSFRMKITDANSGALVYDNQQGTPDGTISPTQQTYLGGGSIVIHDK